MNPGMTLGYGFEDKKSNRIHLSMKNSTRNEFRYWLHVPVTMYTTLTNFSTKYIVMCKVYTDVGGIK